MTMRGFSAGHSTGIIVVVVAIAQAIVAWWRVKDGAYFNDEFYDFMLYQEMGLTAKYLFFLVFSQVAPGFRLVFAVLYSLTGIHYCAAAALIVVMSVGSAVMFVAVAMRALAPPFVVAALSVIYIGLSQAFQSQTWWADFLHVFPGVIAVLVACFAVVGPDGRGPTPNGRIVSGVAFMIGLLFHSKVLFAVLLLAGLAMFIRLSNGERFWRGFRGTLRDLSYVVAVIPLYLVMVYLASGFLPAPAPVTTLKIVKFVAISLFDGTLAATLSLGTYSNWLGFWPSAVVGGAMFLAIIWTGWRCNGSATLILWGGFLAYIAIAMAVVGVQRYGVFATAPYWPRYHVQGAAFLLLFTAISLRGVDVPTFVKWGSFATACLVFVSTQAALKNIPPNENFAKATHYVTNIHASIGQLTPGSIVRSGDVPNYIVQKGMAPYNDLGRFLRLFVPSVKVASDGSERFSVSDEGVISPIR